MTALLAMTAFAGCSGDDEEKRDADAPAEVDPSVRESARELAEQAFERACEVSVQITGPVEASWDGKATVTNASGVTMYQAMDGDDVFVAYAGSDDLPTSANVTIAGVTYTTTNPEDGLDIAEDGTSATVDADTQGIDGPGPHVSGSFSCAEKKT